MAARKEAMAVVRSSSTESAHPNHGEARAQQAGSDERPFRRDRRATQQTAAAAGLDWHIKLGLGLALAFSVGGVEPAQASDQTDRCQRNMACRIHSDKGISYSERKNYAEALAEFQAAYAAEPAPRLLLNIGRSLYRLDRPQEALDYYGRYRKAESSLDAEAEKTLRKYEIDALMASAATGQSEPVPAPLSTSAPPSRWPPAFTLGLLGASVGLFIVGIGLGAGASQAGADLSLPANNFTVFGAEARGIEARGMNLQTAGIAFDILGLVALAGGAASLGTWLYMKKSSPPPLVLGSRSRGLAFNPPDTGPIAITHSPGVYQ